jgi:copper-transporting P-type ATPase V
VTTTDPSPVADLDLAVEGMTCGSCAARVERVLSRAAGVQEAEVNFATGRAHVRIEPGTDVETLQQAVRRIGYDAALLHVEAQADEPADPVAHERVEARKWLWRNALAWPPSLVVLYLSMGGMLLGEPMGLAAWQRWTIFGLTIPVQFVAGWPFLREAARRALRATANMDTLIALGTLAAFSYSTVVLLQGGQDLYFEVAAMIIAFLALGRYFEARA